MPYYLFERDDGTTDEVFFHMNDEKVYNGPNGDEVGRWKRVFLVPQASIDSEIDPFDKNAFINNLAGKKETIGSVIDRSAEMSERRAEKCGGTDPIKQKALDAYAKKRHGKRHPEELKQSMRKANDEANKALGKLGIKINLAPPKSRRLTG